MSCLQCFASNAYSCFSRAALTAMAVLKVFISIGIIVIVAVKLENFHVELQVPLDQLTTLDGLRNATASLIAGGSTTGPANMPPPPVHTVITPSDSTPPLIDINSTAGPLHVDAVCLLQKRGAAGQLDGNSRTICSYIFSVCAISLAATFIMASLLWCTCHCCGLGPVLELTFAVLGTAWWLAAALVVQEHTAVSFNVTVGLPPPAGLPHPPPALPPGPAPGNVAAELWAVVQEWTPRSLSQWRQAVVVLSWIMMGMFAATSVLLLVEACGCMLDCMCRCCCCPERPEGRWRANMRNRRMKRLGGNEYVEMCGAPGGGSMGGPPAPKVMVVARSDEGGPGMPADWGPGTRMKA